MRTVAELLQEGMALASDTDRLEWAKMLEPEECVLLWRELKAMSDRVIVAMDSWVDSIQAAVDTCRRVLRPYIDEMNAIWRSPYDEDEGSDG